MTTDPNFNPSSDAATLLRRVAVMHVAASELLQVALLFLAEDKHRALDALLENGGRVGVEATTDRQGERQVLMVGLNKAGERLLIATVQAPDLAAGASRH